MRKLSSSSLLIPRDIVYPIKVNFESMGAKGFTILTHLCICCLNIDSKAHTTYEECIILLFRHIDTAAIFPASPGTNAEQAVGKAISGSNIPRKEIFLSTKIGPE